jgi:(p)ppGpp synthase/HD superfamily hydrolase
MSHSPPSIDVVSRARAFAIEAHGQQRYGDQPYSVHLDAVVELLGPYTTDAQAIGYLHDVLEDTAVTADRVRQEFGELIAQCVKLVSDEPGVNRKERKTRTNAKLSKTPDELQLALVVKAADRLANLRMSARGGSDTKLDMYRREHAAFREAAFRPGLCDEFWAEMDRILSRRPREA